MNWESLRIKNRGIRAVVAVQSQVYRRIWMGVAGGLNKAGPSLRSG
jgi:hypothetical protein